MSASLHTVHIRVNDSAGGQPTAARLSIYNPQGEYYAPFGRLADFATFPAQDVGGNVLVAGRKAAFIDGSCEIRLPDGPLHIWVSKGPEFTPIETTLTLGKGQISLRFSLERWTESSKSGWYSGDTRAHHLSPHAALIEAAAEDLAFVNLLAKAS